MTSTNDILVAMAAVAVIVATFMLCSVIMWNHISKFGKWLWKLLQNSASQTSQPAVAPAVDPIKEQRNTTDYHMGNLKEQLASIAKDASTAAKALEVAEHHAQALVAQIVSITAQADELAESAQELESLMEAIANNKELDRMKCAAAVRDENIKTLAMASTSNPAYWNHVGRMTAAQIGTLVAWQRSYRDYVGAVMAEVSTAKSMLSVGRARLELADGIEDAALLQSSLQQAHNLLQMAMIDNKPAVKNLPAVNAKLLT